MSIFEKIYDRINWQNKPSTETPINADNLNVMDSAIDVLDDRVVSLSENVNTNTTDISTLQSDVSANSEAIASISKMKIQSGTYDCASDIAQWVVVDVTFDTPYKEPPFVTVCWWNSLPANENIILRGITKTGFSYAAFNSGSTTTQWLTYWQAIGEVE